MCTKNEEFHRRSKGGDLGKLKVVGLGGVLEAYYIPTMFQKEDILPNLVLPLLFELISERLLCRCPKGLFG